MGLFSKRNEVVDLTETVIPQKRKIEKNERIGKPSDNQSIIHNETKESSNSVLDFMSGQSSSQEKEEVIELPDLKIMLKNANQRIEDHSHELYKLLHKIELLEKKVERLENRNGL